MKILEVHTFDHVKSMLESPDAENAVMGFEILKNATLCKENIVYMLWMIEEADIPRDHWFNHTPEIMDTLQKITSISINHKTFSPSEIMRIMRAYGEELPENNYEVFAERYARYMEKLLPIGTSLQFKVQLKITRL